jgi:hypothetical protein
VLNASTAAGTAQSPGGIGSTGYQTGVGVGGGGAGGVGGNGLVIITING